MKNEKKNEATILHFMQPISIQNNIRRFIVVRSHTHTHTYINIYNDYVQNNSTYNVF